MLVLLQISKRGGVGVYGPFDSNTDKELVRIFKEGGYENEFFPVDGEHGIRKGFSYENKHGHSCVICSVEPMNSTSIIFDDLPS